MTKLFSEVRGVFGDGTGCYSAKGDPHAPIPEPPQLGSTSSMASKRFEETNIDSYGSGEDYSCAACKHDFSYVNNNSPDEEAPKFCPECGRRNG